MHSTRVNIDDRPSFTSVPSCSTRIVGVVTSILPQYRETIGRASVCRRRKWLSRKRIEHLLHLGGRVPIAGGFAFVIPVRKIAAAAGASPESAYDWASC